MKNSTALYIPEDIHNQIMALVNGCDIEISWLGQLKLYKEGYIVSRIHVPEQECTCATTEIDAASVGKIEYECITKYASDGELMWWGHSHVNMPAMWSQQDFNTIEGHGRDGAKFLATVFNRKGDRRTAYIQGKSDKNIRVLADDLKSVVIPSETTVARLRQVTEKKMFPKFDKVKHTIDPSDFPRPANKLDTSMFEIHTQAESNLERYEDIVGDYLSEKGFDLDMTDDGDYYYNADLTTEIAQDLMASVPKDDELLQTRWLDLNIENY